MKIKIKDRDRVMDLFWDRQKTHDPYSKEPYDNRTQTIADKLGMKKRIVSYIIQNELNIHFSKISDKLKDSNS